MANSQIKSPDWILLVGQLLAQLSDKMLSIGLIWIIAKNFGDTWVTWYLVVGGIPHLIFFSLNAKLIQKIGALKVVIATDWIRAIIYFVASLLISNVEHKSELVQVMSLIFASNAMAAFFNPAIFSLPIEIATGLSVQKLTARLSAITSITTVLGPISGIFCFQSFGLHGLFIFAATFYLLSGICGWILKANLSSQALVDHNLSTPESEHHDSMMPLKISPLITSMLLVFLFMNLLTSPLQILMPSMARLQFSGSFNSLAAMESGLGIGITIGGLALSFYTIKSKNLLFTWLFLVGVSLSFFAFQFSPNLFFAAGFLALLGIFVGLGNILILNIFQSQPRPETVPKIMSYVNLISSAAVPLSLIMAGFLQTKFSINQIGVACAILLLIVCISSWVPFRHWGKEFM